MCKSLLYKEWIKTRWYLAAAFVVLIAFSAYAMVRLYRALAMMGAGHIWEVMVTRHAVFVEQLEYLPLLAGLLLAVVKFAPESLPGSWSLRSWECSCRGMPPDGPPTFLRPG